MICTIRNSTSKDWLILRYK